VIINPFTLILSPTNNWVPILALPDTLRFCSTLKFSSIRTCLSTRSDPFISTFSNVLNPVHKLLSGNKSAEDPVGPIEPVSPLGPCGPISPCGP
jgi:hypothetical protein